LRFVDRHDWIAPWTLAIACGLMGGWSGVVVGFFWSTSGAPASVLTVTRQ
jgi:stearoyl-CoA desaturase (delta-9 desaturase)